MANDLIEIGINVRSNADQATRGLTRLESTVVKQVREVNRLEKGYRDLDKAMNLGKITAQTYARGVQQVDSAIEAVWDSSKRASNSVNAFTQSIDRSATATKRMQGAAVGNVRSQNALGVATQQAGYQIGDFLVQVQSGTNAMVAFGQQATQLVGVLPLFSPKLIGISAALGIMIPLFTAVGAAMARTSEETTKTTFDFQRFSTDVKASLEPLMPVFTAIGNAASSVGQAVVKMTNLAVNNLDSILVAAAAVSALFVAKMIPAIISATKAIVAMTAAALKNPLFLLATAAATLSVGFYKLVEATGSWGEAISLLGEVASGVWNGIVTSAKAIPTGLQSVWATVSAGFYKMVGNLQRSWLKFLNSLSRGLADMGATGPSSMIAQFAENVGKGLDNSIAKADEFSTKASKLTEDAKNLATEGFTEAQIAMGKLSDAMSSGGGKVEDLGSYFKEVEDSSEGAGKAGSKAGKDIEESVRTANDVFKDAIVTAEEFEIQMAEGVVSAVDSVANAWGDFVMRGFQDFKGFVDSVWSSFKSLISDMISTAAKNRIMISLGMAGSGTGAAGAAGGLLGGGGGIASTLGSIGTSMAGGGFMGGVGSGLMGVLSGGGLGSSFANLGGMLSGSVGITGGAIGAALPAAATVIGIPLLIAGLMKKTEVLVAEGVRARIDGATAELDSYEKTKTNNAFGFSSGFSRDFTRLDDAVQNAVQTRLDTTIQALGAFGLGTDLSGFSFSKRTEIKEGESFEGESEEVINEALNAAIEHLSDGALDMFQKTGESLSSTLDRLTTSIQTVNPIVDVMGGNILDVSLEGASAASALVDLVGGLEAFGNKSAFVFDNFLTDAEKMTIAEDRLNTAFENINNSIEGVNVSLPETHEAFLALKNSQDLSTEAGRQLHAALLEVAPQFVKVNGTAQEVADSVGNDLNPALDEFNVKGQTMKRLLLEEARLKGDTAYIREQEMEGLTDLEASVQQRIHDLKDEAATYKAIEEGANAALRAAQGALDIAQDNLRIAETGVDTAFDRLRVSIDSVVQRLETNLEGANERVDTSRRIFDLLASTVRDRRFGATQLSESNFGRARQSALGFLRSGDVTDERKLEDALRVVSEPSEGLFGSFTDYARDFFRTSSTIADLEKTAGVQLNADEQAVVALEEQISQAESQMDVMREQYNTLLGIESGVLSIPDAISNLQGAFSNLTSAQTAVDTARADVDAAEEVAEVAESAPENLGPVEALYESMLGRSPDTAGLEFWRGTGLSGKELVDAFRVGAIGQGEVPQFASGGAHTGGIRMVGEQGPELEVTGPARIYSNSQTSSMFRDPDLRESVNELKREVAGLRSETVQLQATNNKFTKRNYDLYRKWDVDGQPPQRT